MLTDEQINEFRRLYQKYFDKGISREEAHERGAKLVRLIELISKSSKLINKN